MTDEEMSLVFSQDLMAHGHMPKDVTADGTTVTVDIPRPGTDLLWERLAPFRYEGTAYDVSLEEKTETTAEDNMPVTRYKFTLTPVEPNTKQPSPDIPNRNS